MKKKVRLILLFGMLFFSLSKASSEIHFDSESGWYYIASYNGQGNSKNPEAELILMFSNIEGTRKSLSNADREFLYPIGKLTKTMERLIWKALNDYAIKDGEMYAIVLSDFDCIYDMEVIITNNGKSYYWYDIGVFKILNKK